MNKDDIKKAFDICCDAAQSCTGCPILELEKRNGRGCKYNMFTSVFDLITEQEKEIERLKVENARLTTKLGQVLLAVDTVKEMNAMCNIEEQVKQAKIDVLNELKDKMFEREYMGVKYKERIFYESEINDMIAEVQNGED